ncbi:Hansenula MRAKII killer toxin-resistant protein 1 [Actinoplanes sp. L3-i22]|uniref:Hansenula MRAKII killer toxin-resistant protein 1 n=1 Tax=Actinoplanes sp. L3-i22 TaxID=2836373 RepID=UPI001C864ACE|nr:Hansenula MRAKII killer toxin-resistant protein 1 [Actinoplanes sp. L3-i22]
MAEKGWTAQAGAAAGIAAGAGAAQLGLGYGLGVIEWPTTATASDSTWLNSLGWATWITASATVLGAVIAGRLRADRPAPWRTLWRIALSAAAALGALISVALVALPARSAVRPNGLFSHSPQLVAVGYTLIGLVAGIVVAFWAVSSAPVAANLLGTAAWLWALAVAGVAAELATDRDLQTYLTSWQFAETQTPIRYGGIYWPSAALTLTAAFLIGLLMAWPAARRGNLGLGTATSGAVGPLLVAISFLSLAPLLTEAAGPLQSAYLIAPYAVLAGLAGSALTVALAKGSRGAARRENPPLPLPAGQSAEVPAAAADTESSAAVAKAATPTRPVPAQPRPAPQPAPATPPDKASAKPTKRAKFTSDAEPYAPDLSEEEPPAAGRRRWLLFGKRRPAESVAETPAEPADSEPTGRGRKSRTPEPVAAAAAPAAKPASPTAKPEAPRPGPAAKPTPPKASTSGNTPAAGFADPELAAAARPAKSATKRAAARKEATPRSTITPPPANPPIARINPRD